jgi:hypothetical protein
MYTYEDELTSVIILVNSTRFNDIWLEVGFSEDLMQNESRI